MADLQVRMKCKDENWVSFGDNLHLLTEKAYPGLQDEAQEVLALNHFLAQLKKFTGKLCRDTKATNDS